MEQAKKDMSLKERVGHFITLLKRKDSRFNNAAMAHAHLVQQLRESELICSTDNNMLTMAQFRAFVFNDTYNLYLSITTKQTILLHVNGAYAIYQNIPEENEGLLEKFSVNPTKNCLVHIPNMDGHFVW